MEYYPRKLEEEIDKFMKRKEIIVIKGPRQAGKTTLLRHFEEKYGGKYITLEDMDVKREFERNPKEFIRRYQKNKILYIDEIQYSKKAGKILKLIYDLYSEKIKLVVTGSGSFDIKVPVGAYLVGRCVYFELFPLDFEEFISWKSKDLLPFIREAKRFLIEAISGEAKDIYEIPFEREFYSLFSEYLKFGGMPAVAKEEDEKIKKEILKNIILTYLERDVSFFFDIRDTDKFMSFAKYLVYKIGKVLNLSSASSDLGISYKTLSNYFSILKYTYFFFNVKPFFRNPIKEIKKARKIYFLDQGLANSILNDFRDFEDRYNKGEIIENFIFNELRRNLKDFEIKYWRTKEKTEVDFVLEKGGELIPIEVKTLKSKITPGLKLFIKEYSPKAAIVINLREVKMERYKNTLVYYVKPYYF